MAYLETTGRTNMEITVFNERAQSTEQLEFTGTTVQELLAQIEVNPETILVIKNGEVITHDHQLEHQDFIELLSVISGG